MNSMKELRKNKNINAIHKIVEIAEDISQKVQNHADKNLSHHNSGCIQQEDLGMIFHQVSTRSNEMEEVWKYHEKDMKSFETKLDEDKFLEVYLNVFTEAFADELNVLRHTCMESIDRKQKKNQINQQTQIRIPVIDYNVEENVNVDVLRYMVESGMDFWTEQEKELFLIDGSNNSRKKGVERNSKLHNPHEERRSLLFGDKTV